VTRFLADENVSRLVVERLRAAGFDVASVRETTPGASDKDILDAADSDDRVLITEDRDFGELVVRQRLKVRGVILLELDRLPSAAEAELVAEIVRIHESKLTGNLLVVEPARVRVRPCRGKLENPHKLRLPRIVASGAPARDLRQDFATRTAEGPRGWSRGGRAPA
jgi:predicted nuclease of predicted toxin-antitoxin system